MTEKELARERVKRWRLRPDLAPNNEKEIREFVKEVGLCYTYHTDSNTIPSLLQTISGDTATNDRFSYSHNNPFQEILTETFHTYYKQRLLVEVGCFGKHPVIVYRDVLVHLYRLLHTPKKSFPDSAVRRSRTTKLELAVLKFVTHNHGATKREIRLAISEKPKRADGPRLTRAIESLSRKLKLVRIRQPHTDEILWLTPAQWYARINREAASIDREEAVEYLIRRFLRTTIASSRRTIRNLFKPLIPKQRIDYSLNSLLQRGIIVVDPSMIIDGKRAIKMRTS